MTERARVRLAPQRPDVEEEGDGVEVTYTNIDSLSNMGIAHAECAIATPKARPALAAPAPARPRASARALAPAPLTPTARCPSHPSLAPRSIAKLKQTGIHSVEQLQMTSHRQLAFIKGLSDTKVDKLLDSALKLVQPVCRFQTAKDLQTHRDDTCIKVSTGCAEFDQILCGGFESGSITEIYGEARAGKSQLALTVAVASFLPREAGGGEGRTLYLDTEGAFRPERLIPIATRFDLDADFVQENVMHARIYNCDQLDAAIAEAGALFACEDPESAPFRTLVVDSIIGPYRQEFPGRGELAERQQRMGRVLWMLKKIAETFNIAVVLTNQVTADPGAMAGPDAKKPVGGNILAHAVNTRIMLRKGKGAQRIAKIVQSPLCGELEAHFEITEGGVQSVTD